MSAGKTSTDFLTLIEMDENARAELIEILTSLINQKDLSALMDFMDEGENTRYFTEDELDWLRGFIKYLKGRDFLN